MTRASERPTDRAGGQLLEHDQESGGGQIIMAIKGSTANREAKCRSLPSNESGSDGQKSSSWKALSKGKRGIFPLLTERAFSSKTKLQRESAENELILNVHVM